MIGNQHAETAVTQMLNNALDIDNGNGVNPSKRFIQQDKLRIGSQRAGDFHTATFPPGERLTHVVAQMLDVELFHQLVCTVFTLFAREIVTDLQHGHQVIEYAQTAENRRLLRQIANPTARAGVQR